MCAAAAAHSYRSFKIERYALCSRAARSAPAVPSSGHLRHLSGSQRTSHLEKLPSDQIETADQHVDCHGKDQRREHTPSFSKQFCRIRAEQSTEQIQSRRPPSILRRRRKEPQKTKAKQTDPTSFRTMPGCRRQSGLGAAAQSDDDGRLQRAVLPSSRRRRWQSLVQVIHVSRHQESRRDGKYTGGPECLIFFGSIGKHSAEISCKLHPLRWRTPSLRSCR